MVSSPALQQYTVGFQSVHSVFTVLAHVFPLGVPVSPRKFEHLVLNFKFLVRNNLCIFNDYVNVS